MHLTTEQIQEIIKIAQHNDGHCITCFRTIKIYKYRVSETMAKIMREMSRATKQTGERIIDMETLGLTHTERSQLSKMRQHGLVVQPKDERNVKKPRHWLITTKGWKFLRGEPIEAKVIVFDNQVLGHEGGTCTIRQLLNDPGFYESDPLTPAEAGMLHDVRTPKRQLAYSATYQGSTDSKLTHGASYKIFVERLEIRKPVNVDVEVPDSGIVQHVFNDIAGFQRTWKVQTA